MEQTIEKKVADAILEQDIAVLEIEGKTYNIAPPTIATLILVSEIVSRFPVVPKDTPKEQVLYSVLHYAKDYSALGELVAVLILGAKNLTEEVEETIVEKRFFGLLRKKRTVKRVVDRRYQLAKEIIENVRPSVLFDIIINRLNRLEISNFFVITTSLSEANILRATKEVVTP